jgi:hypothetical protein
LDLSDSIIASIPHSIGQLSNLKELDLSSTGNLRKLPEEIGNLTQLIKLNWSKPFPERIVYRLACSRARCRTGFGMAKRVQIPPKLLPLTLSSATRAFSICLRERHNNAYQKLDFVIDPPDAIHHVLLYLRDEFIGVLVNRKKMGI